MDDNMTTDTPQTTNSAPLTDDYKLIWDSLTPELQKELIEISNPSEPVRDVHQILLRRNMVYFDDNNLYEIKLTEYGRQILATQPSAPDGAKPATITAGEVAAEIIDRLNDEEIGVLRDMRKGYSHISDEMWNRLFSFGLIRFPITDFIGLHNLTDLGRAVLAQVATRALSAASVDDGGEAGEYENPTLEDYIAHQSHYMLMSDGHSREKSMLIDEILSLRQQLKGRDEDVKQREDDDLLIDERIEFQPIRQTGLLVILDRPQWEHLQAENQALRERLASEQATVKGLRDALSFYADGNNWVLRHNSGFDYEYVAIDEDKGRRAAAALQAASGEEVK